MAQESPRFRPLQPVRLSDGAVDQLYEMIIKGEFSPGERLPGERQLATELGVSRTAARDALRILEGKGLISVQQGRGTFVVSDVDEVTSGARWAEWLAQHKDQVLQITELRDCLDNKAAELAAERATTSAIDAVAHQLDIMKEAIERNDVAEIIAADRAFHALLYRASGNELLAILRESLYLTLQGRIQTVFRMTNRGPDALAEHHAILKAVKERDPEAAGRAARDHSQLATQAMLRVSGLGEAVSETERAM